jgi:hypothetical protein
MSLANCVETVAPRGRAPEQIGFFGAAGTLRHQLAGIPEDRITVGNFVDRKVTLKHRARGAESFNARFNIGAECIGWHFRRWRFGLLVEAQAIVALAKSAELNVNVWSTPRVP